jgi:hypothetical protein
MQRETRTTTPTAQAAAMPAFAPVLRPEESGGGRGGGTAVEDGEVDIVSFGERVEEERRAEAVAEGETALGGVAFGADADVGDDDAAWTRGVSWSVVVILPMSARAQ